MNHIHIHRYQRWRLFERGNSRVAGRPLMYSLAVCHIQGGWETSRIQISGSLHVVGTSTSTEIEISPSALWKITKLDFFKVPVGHRAKVSITDPPQFWVKGSIVVDGNRNFTFGHYEKSQNWVFVRSLLVLEQKCQLPTPHNFRSRVQLLLKEIGISGLPLWKITKLGFCMVPVGPRAKVSITDPPQFWVKGSIVVDGNQNFSSAIMKNHKIGFLHGPWWS